MRVLAGFKYVAENRFKTPYVLMVWRDFNRDLFGKFEDVFDPIPGVFFIPPDKRAYYEKFAMHHFKNTWIMMAQNIVGWHQLVVNDMAKLEQEYYTKLYRPIKKIREDVLNYIKQNNICEARSFHLRRTDLETDGELGKVMTKDHIFEEAIKNTTGPVFITTDNPKTREKFLSKFGKEKVLVYGIMPEEKAAGSFRYTDLVFSVTEAFIASRSAKFMGTVGSSWSETIDAFHRECNLNNCCKKEII